MHKIMEKDPFGLFDESEDESEDDSRHEEAKRLASDLVSKTNSRQQKATVTGASALPPVGRGDTALVHKDAYTAVEGLKWPEPAYMGPISIVKSGAHIGGGRQAIALEDLSPGTPVLLEKPLVSWSSEDNILDLDFVEMIFSTCSSVEQLLHCVEDLHPTKDDVDGISDINESSSTEQIKLMMEDLEEEYEDNPEVERILEQISSQNIRNVGGTPFCRTDFLRLILALRYNALETGLFMYTAMLNHNDRPNCVKFKGGKVSEVRATRWISKGEMLTITYVPRILCHASRRLHLWKQHRFDIGEDPSADMTQMELITNRLPPSSIVEEPSDSLTQRIETTLYDLSSHVEELESSPMVDANQAIALELSSMELFCAAREQLQNETHVLLLPCLKLHVDACALVQKSSSMSSSGRVKLLERLISSAEKLLNLQRMYHGPDHFDVARTDLDLAEAIGELKARSSERLIRLDLEGLRTSRQWATYESKLRKDYTRIKVLYETQISS